MSGKASHYDVSTWDHEAQGWRRRAAGVRQWTVRRVLRRLYAAGWSDVSIKVEREDEWWRLRGPRRSR